MPNGEVNITVLDGGGSVVVPGAQTQLVLGCCSGGTVNQVVATTQIAALTSAVGYGVGVEAAALSLAAGGVVLFMKLTQNALGTATAVTFTGTGSSVVTVTLDGVVGAYDDYNVMFKCVTGGTRGTAGITFQISLDAGRTFGPTLALGTATSYTIPNTGVTIAFAAGTLVAGDVAKFSTCAPSWNTAGVQAALNAFAASAYANNGVGTIHLVGASSSASGQSAGAAGADVTAVQGYLDTLVTGFSYNRLICSARDAKTPTAWGGTGETEATWIAAVQTDYASVSAKRVGAAAGYYNMQSQIPNAAAGAPRYRRPLAWTWAARQVQIPTQRHAGRVKDGALLFISVNAANDPTDGFVYHDDFQTPGLDTSRFTSARQRRGLPGYYIVQPRLMSSPGSDFDLFPKGLVMDVACSLTHQVGQAQINDDLRLTPAGTLYPPDAATVGAAIDKALKDNMLSVGMISDKLVTVDLTNNVASTSTVNVSITIQGKGYVLQENVNIGFGSTATP